MYGRPCILIRGCTVGVTETVYGRIESEAVNEPPGRLRHTLGEPLAQNIQNPGWFIDGRRRDSSVYSRGCPATVHPRIRIVGRPYIHLLSSTPRHRQHIFGDCLAYRDQLFNQALKVGSWISVGYHSIQA
jgi:hypothetical protein